MMAHASGHTAATAADLLSIQSLTIRFHTREATLTAVRDLNLALQPGEILGLVGESGCGKSVTAQAILRLIGADPCESIAGSILYHGDDLLHKTEVQMSRLRGSRISMIFQDPMTALNPVIPIGEQIAEMLRWHQRLSRKAAWHEAIGWLERVGITHASKRVHQYPHEFSGGMRQRVVIALALCCQPDLLIADEPTTALDATVQSQIMALLQQLRAESGAALIVITHDLQSIATICDRVAVMYAGSLVETGPTRRLLDSPQHPYTQGLLASIPQLGQRGRLTPIPGQPPDPGRVIEGCPFAERCPHVHARCRQDPPVRSGGPQHHAACWLVGESAKGESS